MKTILHQSIFNSIQALLFKRFAYSTAYALPPVIPEKRHPFHGISSENGGSREIHVPADAESLLISKKDHTFTLLLNRPELLNAIDLQMAEALREQLKQAATDPAIRVVVITGKGRAFCAGGDLKFAVEANPDQPGDSFQALTSVLHESIELIRSLRKPVVAAINGPAAGAGLFLALACDIRLMADTAYLKASNTSYGLSIPASGTYTLPRLIGMGRALEMVMLDLPVSARAAQSMGLVTFLAEEKSFDAQVEAFTYELSQKAVHTLGQVKKLMNESFTRSLQEQLLAEQQAIVNSANHPEGREGLAAFLQKRNPDFAAISN